MQANTPAKFPIPFAAQAGSPYKRQVPLASQVGITPGAASLTDGFPPDNFIALEAGGIAFSGQDVNGLLNQITDWLRYVAAGGPVQYDAAFQTAIGGYPVGARIVSASTAWIWRSTADNNTTNPDAGGGGWVRELDGLAPLASPALSGSPTAPTAPDGDSSELLANTYWARQMANEVANAVASAYANSVRFPEAGVSFQNPGSVVWTVPAGVSRIKVICTGGGAGGNGCDGNQSGSGGGAGGTAIGYIAVYPGQQIVVSVGGGGASGYNQNGNVTNSGGGGTSSFGVYLSAVGGGPAGVLAGSRGGAAYGGYVNAPGGNGTDASPSSALYGGLGGVSYWGGGGRAANNDSDPAMLNGAAPGSGGGGGYGGSAAGYGGAGANGIVVIEF